jgi:shikimate dehydrogenase
MAEAQKFRLAGIMGWPVAHSRSPLIHGYWIKQLGLSGAYVYLPVRPERLAEALRGLSALGFAGCNVTIPHKEAAMRLLDRVDPLAKRIGAINTVVVEPDGSLSGSNTDAFGFVESLKETQPDWRADAGPAIVVGAGGGARAVVASLAERGAKDLRVVNRTEERAQKLAMDFGAPVRAIPWDQRRDALEGASLLVNATSQGMAGQPPLDLSLDRLPQTALVADIVYIPRETPLLAAARQRGNPVAGGLGMLIHQARAAFGAWFGVMPQATAELRALLEETI